MTMMQDTTFVPLGNVRQIAQPVAPAQLRVALVCMPWGSIQKTSLAMGLLKQVIVDAGHTPELHYLNFLLARQIGLSAYESISEGSVFQQEWLFAQRLFGPEGTGELNNRWDDLIRDENARPVWRSLLGHASVPGEYLKSLAETELPKFLDDAFASAPWGNCDVVGFTTTFAQSLSSLALAKRIKEAHPRVAIVFGGANVDAEMGNEFIRAFPWVDHAVHGEAEVSFPRLLQVIAEGRKEIQVAGVTSRNGKVIYDGHRDSTMLADLNLAPHPDYSDYFSSIEKMGFKGKFKLQLFFESARGCWWGAKYHCTFCGLNGGTMAFREKNPDAVIQGLLKLSSDHACLFFSATDNIISNKYWENFLPRLAGLGLDLRLFYEVKANLNLEQLTLLHAAGVREIQPGIESFSTRLLKLMSKGVTAIQNVQLLKWCYEIGIRPVWNMLYGIPGETEQDYERMPETIRALSHLYPPSDTPLITYERFSPYHSDSQSFGLDLRPSGEYAYIFPQPRVALDRIAYFFQDGDGDKSDQARERVAPVLAEIDAWKKSWAQQVRYCFYEKGPGFILLYDNRPLTRGATEEARLLKLGGQLCLLYLYCETIRSWKAILRQFGDGENPASERNAALQSALTQLVAQKLLYEEDGRYLALAVRKSSRQHWPDKY